MFGSTHLRRDTVVAILVIEDSSASITLMSKDSGRVIVYDRAQALAEPQLEGTESASTATLIHEVGTRVMDAYSKTGMRAPVTSAYCIVHEPYARTRVRRAVKSFEEDTRISSDIVKELFRSACAEELEADPEGILEAGVLAVELNGYATDHPVGQYAHTAELFAISSDINSELKKAIGTALWSLWPAAYISWRSGIRSILSVERVLQHKREYVAVVVGPGCTSIYGIDNGTLYASHTVREGLRTILARAGGSRNPMETASYFRMIARDACEDDTCAAILGSLGAAEPDLVRVFGDAFSALSTGRKLPNDIVLVADADLGTWLTRFFGRIDFSQFTATTLPFNVEQISAKQLSTVIECPDTLSPVLALGAAHARIELRR